MLLFDQILKLDTPGVIGIQLRFARELTGVDTPPRDAQPDATGIVRLAALIAALLAASLATFNTLLFFVRHDATNYSGHDWVATDRLAPR